MEQININKRKLLGLLNNIGAKLFLKAICEKIAAFTLYLSISIFAFLFVNLLLNNNKAYSRMSLIFWLAVSIYLAINIVYRLLSLFRYKYLSGIIGAIFPEIADSVNTAVDFVKNQSEIKRLNYSIDLADSSLKKAIDNIGQLDLDSVKIGTTPLWYKRVGYISIICLLLIAISSPHIISKFISDYSVIYQDITPRYISQTRIYEPGDVLVGKNSKFNLNVSVYPKSIAEPVVFMLSSRGTWDKVLAVSDFIESATKKRNNPESLYADNFNSDSYEKQCYSPYKYTFELNSGEKDSQYFVALGNTVSKFRNINVIKPLNPDKFIVAYKFPDYTRLEKKESEQANGNLIAYPGSFAKIELLASNLLQTANIVINSSESPVSLIEDNKAIFTIGIKDASSYGISLTDKFNQKFNADYIINTIKDLEPLVRILNAKDVDQIPDSMQVVIKAKVSDDFGITKADLVYMLNNIDEEFRAEINTESAILTTSIIEGATLTFDWNLIELDLLPGDEISYWVEVFDNDIISGPKLGKSSSYILRFPSMYEMYEPFEKQTVQQTEDLEDIIEKQREIREKTDRLIKAIEKKEKTAEEGDKKDDLADWQKKSETENIKSEQQKISDEVKQIADQIAEQIGQMDNENLFEMKTLEKMQKIRELLDKVLTDEMKRIMNALNQALEDMAKDLPPEELENASLDMDKFEQELDRMLDLLKNTYFEQKMERLVKQSEELQKIQEELAKETKELNKSIEDTGQETPELEAKAKQIAEKQKKLEEKADDLVEEIEKASDEMGEEFGTQKDFLENLARKAKEEGPSKAMQKAKEYLAQMDTMKACSAQTLAMLELNNLKEGLKTACSMFGGKDYSKELLELERLLGRALRLSKMQKDTINRISLFSGAEVWPYEEAKKLIGVSKIAYADDLERLAFRVNELSRKTPFIDSNAIRAFGNASKIMKASARNTEEMSPDDVRLNSISALVETNTGIDILLKTLEELAQMQSMSNADGYFKGLEDLIKKQRNINRQTKQMERRRQQCTTPQWQSMIKRMAEEQEIVRKELEKLQQQYEQMKNLFSRLDDVGADMREVEKLLKKQLTGKNVQDKQEKILTRMLDAQKSQKKQDYSRERESETADQNLSKESPDQLDSDTTKAKEKTMSSSKNASMGFVPIEYRDRIIMYFNKISKFD